MISAFPRLAGDDAGAAVADRAISPAFAAWANRERRPSCPACDGRGWRPVQVWPQSGTYDRETCEPCEGTGHAPLCRECGDAEVGQRGATCVECARIDAEERAAEVAACPDVPVHALCEGHPRRGSVALDVLVGAALFPLVALAAMGAVRLVADVLGVL